MTTQMQEWVKVGKEIGYKEAEIQAFVKEQQDIAREERNREREEREKEREREERTKRKIEEEETERVKLRLAHEKELALIAERGKKVEAEVEMARLQVVNENDVKDDVKSNHSSDEDRESVRTRREVGADRKRKPKGPKLTAYDEKDDIDSFIHRFEQYAKVEGWTEDTWAIYLAALLKGKALDVYTRLPLEEAQDYTVLKEALLKRYEKTEEGYRRVFYSARPEVGEGQHQFIVRLGSYLMKYVEFSGISKSFDCLRDLLI